MFENKRFHKLTWFDVLWMSLAFSLPFIIPIAIALLWCL